MIVITVAMEPTTAATTAGIINFFMECTSLFYAKLDFESSLQLTTPNPALNSTPPARHRTTCMMVASMGVIMGIIMNISIPTTKEPMSDSHVRLFPTALRIR